MRKAIESPNFIEFKFSQSRAGLAMPEMRTQTPDELPCLVKSGQSQLVHPFETR
jgi:hypothetical protein